MTEILNGPVEEINARLIGLVLSELFGKDYGVDKEIIKHLIATYLLYDIAFSKNSVLMSMLGGTDDGTTPTENTGFYPNTKQLHQTVLNKQDGKMMDVYAYPNPVRPEYRDKVTITGLMDNSIVKITDLNGNLVYQTKSLGGQVIWNCQNTKGVRVASGIYLVLSATEDSKESVVTKIAVIK